jgi:hypothetical protein
MVSTRKQKQALLTASPLRDAGILQQVFTFLPGNHLFLGTVCKEWNAVYVGIGDWQVRSFSLEDYPRSVFDDFATTLCSAAVASPATARLACECGLQLLTETSVQVIAGLHADIETLTTLHELGMPHNDTVMEAAALSGRVNILQHLVTKQQCPKPNSLSHFAARSGSISMLKWLKAQSWCTFDDFTCAGAAEGGHLAVLQHLRSEGCDWDVESIECYAASSGSIEVVEWLRQQQGIVVDANVLSWAAGAGQIATCEHLRSTGCDWDSDACDQAVSEGKDDMLRWLREQGCPWSVSGLCTRAVRYGYTHVLDYVIEQGEVLDAELLTDALNWAGAYDKLTAAQWLRRHGAQWPAVLSESEDSYIQQWRGDTLAWARAAGCTSPNSLMN